MYLIWFLFWLSNISNLANWFWLKLNWKNILTILSNNAYIEWKINRIIIKIGDVSYFFFEYCRWHVFYFKPSFRFLMKWKIQFLNQPGIYDYEKILKRLQAKRFSSLWKWKTILTCDKMWIFWSNSKIHDLFYRRLFTFVRHLVRKFEFGSLLLSKIGRVEHRESYRDISIKKSSSRSTKT